MRKYVENMNSDSKHLKYQKENIELRQNTVFELYCLGYNQVTIAKKLNVSLGLVNSDIKVVLRRSQNSVLDYNKRLPQEVDRAFSIYNVLIREAHSTIENTHDELVKLKAIDSIKNITEARIQLASNFDIIKHTPNLFKKEISVYSNEETLSGEEQVEAEEGDTDKE
jgi:hypothetical protein